MNSLQKIILILGAILTFAVMLEGTLVSAYTNTVTETASVTVSTTCIFSSNTATLSFGALSPGANDITNVGLSVTNSGNAASNILIQGTSWSYASNTFGVSNTMWNPIALGSYAGNVLTGSNVDTLILLPDPFNGLSASIGSTTSNSIYFGVAIPFAVPAASWSQTISVVSQC